MGTTHLNQARLEQQKTTQTAKFDYLKKLERFEKFEKSTKPKNKPKTGKKEPEKVGKQGKIEKYLLKPENTNKQQTKTQPSNENLTTTTGNNKHQQQQPSLKEKIMKFSSQSPPKLPTNLN